MIKGISAIQLIVMIANDYVELSHDKIKLQRDDHIRWCKEWLEQNKALDELVNWQQENDVK